jgi:ribosomal protein S18 acetylase RimI-like enzyme
MDLVRPYRQTDREEVRRICFATGMMGEPIDYLWPDLESFADMWTRYYTDLEPESCYVAEAGGKVVGYLTGCVDSSRAWDPVAIGARAVLRRGLFLNPVMLRTLGRLVAESLVAALRHGRLRPDPVPPPGYPAHLHINLLPQARGKGLGRLLVEAFFKQLRALGVTGVHLGTLLENERAVAFFKSVGFRPYAVGDRIPGWRDRRGRALHPLLMVADL